MLDDNNKMVEELSLEHLMSRCNFVNEVLQLGFAFEQLGVRALFMIKYHTEMAGEGVEYSLDHSKNLDRIITLRVNKGKPNFDSTVEYCIFVKFDD